MSVTARPARSSTTVELPADPRSPALARRLVTNALRDGPHASMLDDALLLVTELVTNAIVHAGTSARLSIDTTDSTSLRLEVADRGATSIPSPREAPPTSVSGRGLQMLSALSTSWGTVHTAGEKSVWFTLGSDRRRRGPDRTVFPLDDPTMASFPQAAALDNGLLRWLLMFDAVPAAGVDSEVLLGEAVHRLCDSLGIASAALVECRAGRHRRAVLVERGRRMPAGVKEAAVAWAEGNPSAPPSALDNVLSFRVASSGETLAVLVVDSEASLSETDEIAIQLTCWLLATTLREQRLRAVADRARGNAALLAEASELFAGTLDADVALNLATQLVVPRIGSWAAVWAIGRHGPTLSALTHQIETGAQPLRRAFGAVQGAAFVGRLPALVGDTRSTLIAPADLPPALRALGTGEVLAVSLVARSRPVAIMLVAAPEADAPAPGAGSAGSFDADSVAMVVDVATRAAVAVDVALLFREQQDVATKLQTSLLPRDLPMIADLEFGARYAAAGETNTVGGDFYDVFGLDTGEWVMLVGDVCGRGPEAAAITGLARSVMRACLRDGCTGAEAYARLNREILELGSQGRFCTSALTILRPGPGYSTASLTVAGHPLPVLARANGQVETVGVPGTLIGVEPRLSLHQTDVLLSPGDAVVLYTDGVTERRRGEAMFEESGLLSAVRHAIGRSADGVAAAVEETVRDFSPEISRDDLAVVVVRQPAMPATPARRGGLPVAVLH